MKCKWGTITKHVVVVSLVSLSASVSGPRVGGGRHWRKPSPLDGSIPLPSDTVLEWEGSGLWDPIPVSVVDAYPKNQSFCSCSVSGKLPK